ncbi:arylsulfotransferase family protein [Synechococcus sp. Minos11]|uniref:arylsulfotransferase family protein n=1 Tax=Synechococcus sp. Minos11 TaxID=221341 RepID=UPI00164629FB|nr:arylsulfotransferase family protein [Synechococcus sp. Minos11]QNJ08136.1 arylsulfotransferase family protein [Synechococcus sp. Minos11]
MYSEKCNENRRCQIAQTISKPTRATYYGLDAIRAYFFSKELLSGQSVRSLDESVSKFGHLNRKFNFHIAKIDKKDNGYLLLSYRDVEKDIPAIELWDLSNQTMTYKWETKKACAKFTRGYVNCPGYFMSPVVLNDKSIVFNTQVNGNKLVRIDKDGNILHVNSSMMFHHKVHMDSKKNLYATATKKNTYNDPGRGYAMSIVSLNKELEIENEVNINDIYKDLGLTSKLYSSNSKDPIHVNDVEVLHQENEIIMLIKLRSPGSVIAYNATKDYTYWILDGITKQGHDVDVISADPLVISVFDNNIETPHENELIKTKTTKGNRVLFIHGLSLPKTREKTKIYTTLDSREGGPISIETVEFKKMKTPPTTISAGLSEYNSKTGAIIVEDSNHGRIFSYNVNTKETEWEFINKNKSGDMYGRLGWSSLYKSNPISED